ncbi:MAG: hypothetical protein HDR46_01245 [Bacteroides sp.]|nr:hypothetical protein [Bacteroides sp.]
MKQLPYYLAILAAFIGVWLIGAFICAALCIRGNFLMIIIAVLAVGAAKLTAALLKDKLNPIKPTKTENKAP